MGLMFRRKMNRTNTAARIVEAVGASLGATPFVAWLVDLRATELLTVHAIFVVLIAFRRFGRWERARWLPLPWGALAFASLLVDRSTQSEVMVAASAAALIFVWLIESRSKFTAATHPGGLG